MDQEEVGERWHNGRRTGEASNFKIVETQDGTALISYPGTSDAVVAFRENDGTTHGFQGWRSRSSTTASQMTKADVAMCQYLYSEGRPTLDMIENYGILEVLNREVEP